MSLLRNAYFDTADAGVEPFPITRAGATGRMVRAAKSVVLPFILVSPTTPVTVGSFILPRLPADFQIADALLTFGVWSPGSGQTIDIELYSEVGGAIAQAESLPLSDQLVLDLYDFPSMMIAPGHGQLRADILSIDFGNYAVATGLTLWLRGAWLA